jgi:hypothetical protein
MSQIVNPPISVITSSIYSRFTISVDSLTLGAYARFTVKIFDVSFNQVNSVSLFMEGADYQAWGGDDNYVYEWANAQLHTLWQNGQIK